MYRVALPIETKVRELNGKLWLASHLALRGYQVIIGELTNLKENLDRIKPHIYIGDSALYKKSREDLYRRLKKANVAVAVHDTEGGIIYSHEYYSNRLSNRILRYVDCFLAWGEETAKIFQETVNNKKVMLATVGNPAFDLLYKRHRSFFGEEQKKIIKRFKKFVLINTHFGFYNHYNREKYVNPKRDKFPGLYEFKKQLFNHFVDAIKTLSQANININFVIRPHPSENFFIYKDIFESTKNVFIEHEFSVHPWALAAKLIIHNGCTTGVESALLERPVISFRPITNEKWDVALPNFVSQQARNVVELQSYINTYCLSDDFISVKLTNNHNRVIEKTLSPHDGKSAERICDVFDRLKLSERKQIQLINRKKKAKVLKGFLGKVTLGKKRKSQKQQPDGYSKQKFSTISLEELNVALSKFQELNDEFRVAKIYELNQSNNIFWVQKL